MTDRRPLRFWQPFNDWWRSELEKLGRRPNANEIVTWYHAHAYDLWQDDAPSIQETRVHAKCLRSLPLVRDYFRSYRAKKRNSGSQHDDGPDHEGREEDTAQGEDRTPHPHDHRRQHHHHHHHHQQQHSHEEATATTTATTTTANNNTRSRAAHPATAPPIIPAPPLPQPTMANTTPVTAPHLHAPTTVVPSPILNNHTIQQAMLPHAEMHSQANNVGKVHHNVASAQPINSHLPVNSARQGNTYLTPARDVSLHEQQDLTRNYMITQAQQNAAYQQQLALAALTQQFASRQQQQQQQQHHSPQVGQGQAQMMQQSQMLTQQQLAPQAQMMQRSQMVPQQQMHIQQPQPQQVSQPMPMLNVSFLHSTSTADANQGLGQGILLPNLNPAINDSAAFLHYRRPSPDALGRDLIINSRQSSDGIGGRCSTDGMLPRDILHRRSPDALGRELSALTDLTTLSWGGAAGVDGPPTHTRHTQDSAHAMPVWSSSDGTWNACMDSTQGQNLAPAGRMTAPWATLDDLPPASAWTGMNGHACAQVTTGNGFSSRAWAGLDGSGLGLSGGHMLDGVSGDMRGQKRQMRDPDSLGGAAVLLTSELQQMQDNNLVIMPLVEKQQRQNQHHQQQQQHQQVQTQQHQHQQIPPGMIPTGVVNVKVVDAPSCTPGEMPFPMSATAMIAGGGGVYTETERVQLQSLSHNELVDLVMKMKHNKPQESVVEPCLSPQGFAGAETRTKRRAVGAGGESQTVMTSVSQFKQIPV